MAARLTDKQKKEILADYMESGSYNATAKKFGVSDMTVKRICQRDSELLKKVEQKKEQNTLDMLAYMDSRKEQAQGVIDDYLAAVANPEKIASAKLSEIATALGIVVDKFTKNMPANNDGMSKILENSQTLAEILLRPVVNRDIGDFE